MYCHILQHDPRDLCVLSVWLIWIAHCFAAVLQPRPWKGFRVIYSGAFVPQFSMQRKANSKFEERQVPSKQRLPSDAPPEQHLGGLCSFSPVGSAARREKSLENLRNQTWREKSCRPHGSRIWAISVFLQKRHGKNMSLALSFNRALQKCFAQRVREAKYLRHWSSFIIHQVGCHSIDQGSRPIQGSFGGSIGQNAEVSVWNQGVYQH